MQPISHIAWRRVPETLRQAILRQVSRSTVIGNTPDNLPIDDHLRTQLVAQLQSHRYRNRSTDNISVNVRVVGNPAAITWWSQLTPTERGRLIESLHKDVVYSR